MALFGNLFNTSRPGPGVSKNAPPQSRLSVFFRILWEKIDKMIGLNLLYFAFLIPIVALGFLMDIFIEGIGISFNEILEIGFFPFVITFFVKQPVFILLLIVCIVLYGPATAGFTYVQRNMAREEHAFIVSDFFEHAKKNFKQAVIMSFIDFIVLFAEIGIILTYINSLAQSSAVILSFIIACLFFLVFFVLRFYTYQILVTFELKTIHIYRNALLLAIAAFGKNALILIILFLSFSVIFFYPVFGIILIPVILLSIFGFIINFNIYPTIKRFMIDSYNNRNENAETEIPESSPVFVDKTIPSAKKKKRR